MVTEPHAWGPGELVGEHRLLRRLGLGPRAEVWLAAPVLVEDGPRVALKLARPEVAPETPPDGMLREAEVLWRVRGRHAVRIHDVIPAAGGRPGLVLEHVPHALAELAASGMRAGEAITVLAPIAGELLRLHGLGVVHGGVRLGAIGLRTNGEPVLLGFGGAAVVADRERSAGVAVDASAFRALAMPLVALAGSPSNEWSAFRAWLTASDPGRERWLAEFVRRAFDAAEPEPVALPDELELAGLGGLELAGGPPGAVTVPGPATWPGSPERSLAASALGRLRSLGGIRRRVWVPLAAVAAGLAAIAIVLPSGAGGAAIAGAPASGSPPTAQSALPEGSSPGTPSAPPSPSETAASPPSAAAELVPSARAAIELLDGRARCYAELSRACLDAVVEPGSDADAVDRAAIAALVDGKGELPRPFLAVTAAELQRLGDAAIVDAVDAEGATQRVLLMLTPDGWRIRAYLSD